MMVRNYFLRYPGQILAIAALIYATASTFRFVYGMSARHRVETAWFICVGILLVVLFTRRRQVTAGSTGTFSSAASGGAVGPSDHAWREAAAIGCFVCGAVLLYARVMNIGLLSDDFVLLHNARSGHLLTQGEFFRPLPHAIWGLFGWIRPEQSFVLHVINAVVHGTNSWLVYRVAVHGGVERRWAGAAGVAFLVSASNVEPVTWVSALFDLLMAFGTLIHVLACLQGRLVLGLVGLAIALLSKETGVIAPVLGAGVVVLSGQPLRLPFVAAGATIAFIAARLWLLPPPAGYLVTPTRYVMKELVSRSFGTISLPWTSDMIAGHPMLALFPWLALVGLLACICIFYSGPLGGWPANSRSRQPGVPAAHACAVGWERSDSSRSDPYGPLVITAVMAGTDRTHISRASLFAAFVPLSVLPVYSYFFVSPQMEGSRYVYLGTAAFTLMLVHLACALPRGFPRMVAACGLALSIAASAIGTHLDQQRWIRAGKERDAVLQSARSLTYAACARVSVRNLPDSTNGVYVFRNGFAEALRFYAIETPPLAGAGDGCPYTWTGHSFERMSETPLLVR